MQRVFRMILLGIGGLLAGSLIGAVSGLLVGSIWMPKGYFTMATSSRFFPWVIGGALTGAPLGLASGVYRSVASNDPDAEINEHLDDVEPDTWPNADRDIL